MAYTAGGDGGEGGVELENIDFTLATIEELYLSATTPIATPIKNDTMLLFSKK